MHGGISGGYGSQGFPGIVMLVGRLADHFDVTVYSIAYSREKIRAKSRVCSPPQWLPFLVLRVMWLVVVFCLHNASRSYDRLFALWGYPAGTLAVLMGRIFGKPSITYLLGAETAAIPEIKYGHLRRPLIRKVVLWTCENSSVLIALTERQARVLKQEGCKKVPCVVPFGVDGNQFHPMEKKLTLPLKMLHVANLTPVKDQVTLVRTLRAVLKRLPARLRIVGPDYMDGQIQKLVCEMKLGEHVEFTGPVLHAQIVEHYQWADLCIITSLSEGQNTSLTEAMMCGILPVSTEVGMMDQTVGNTMGIVAPCRDHESLGSQIVELFHNQALWEQKRLAAHEWAKTHDLHWTVQQLKSLIHDGHTN